jgi:nucleotide-binding universal stress UspA family protein
VETEEQPMPGERYCVVVGIDFTKVSEPAMREALRLVRGRAGAVLHVVHVLWETADGLGAEGAARDGVRIEEARVRLHGWVGRQAVEPADRAALAGISFHVRVGHPAACLEEVAADVEADLIVVGTLGLRGFEKLMFGSIADALLARASVPVLIARENKLAALRRSSRPAAAGG